MADSMRQRLERAEDERLQPFALRSAAATRRHPLPPEGRGFDYRTQFQRDRDRIVYSRAFRRLRQKAQSGILPAYEDHRRNRLTHTLEVAQLARTIGRALGLNEDLIEAIGLGHDLGQPAFGPAGERALDDLLAGRLDGRGGPGLGDLGGFSRARQSLRVVDRVEKRYEYPGLNLTDAVREGIFKSGAHAGDEDEPPPGVRAGSPPLLEAQVVLLADRISSALHDLDDALQAGALSLDQIERLGAVSRVRAKLGADYGRKGGRFMKANAIHRGLTHLMVTSAIVGSQRQLERWRARHEICVFADFDRLKDEAVAGSEISLPPVGRRMLEEIERLLDQRVRTGYGPDRIDGRGRRVLLGLFAAYHADPQLLDDHVLLRYKDLAGVRFLRDLDRARIESEVARKYRRDPRFVRVLADHLASMTDAFAIVEHRRLMEMGAIPIPSAEQLRREVSDRE
jgi:dGTPase